MIEQGGSLGIASELEPCTSSDTSPGMCSRVRRSAVKSWSRHPGVQSEDHIGPLGGAELFRQFAGERVKGSDQPGTFDPGCCGGTVEGGAELAVDPFGVSPGSSDQQASESAPVKEADHLSGGPVEIRFQDRIGGAGRYASPATGICASRNCFSVAAAGT